MVVALVALEYPRITTDRTVHLPVRQVSNRDEPFMDLSLDVEQNSSVSACLRNFSSTETLTKKNKFFCESCNALQVCVCVCVCVCARARARACGAWQFRVLFFIMCVILART